MWDLPGPGLKPVSPALAGGFLTTAPPGKPQIPAFCLAMISREPVKQTKEVVEKNIYNMLVNLKVTLPILS